MHGTMKLKCTFQLVKNLATTSRGTQDGVGIIGLSGMK